MKKNKFQTEMSEKIEDLFKNSDSRNILNKYVENHAATPQQVIKERINKLTVVTKIILLETDTIKDKKERGSLHLEKDLPKKIVVACLPLVDVNHSYDMDIELFLLALNVFINEADLSRTGKNPDLLGKDYLEAKLLVRQLCDTAHFMPEIINNFVKNSIEDPRISLKVESIKKRIKKQLSATKSPSKLGRQDMSAPPVRYTPY